MWEPLIAVGTALSALRGAPSLAIVLGLLYLEEAGMPIPFAPGEAVLIGGGLLIASGAVPIWVVVPAEYAVVLAGSLTGFAWARAVGPERLRALAARLRADGPFDRVAGRLESAGVLEIAVSRLIPGLRIYTSLVAGAAGVPFRRFLLGAVPAIAVWVVVFTLLGLFVGIPAEKLLGQAQNLALRVLLVLLLLVAGYLGLRRVPAAWRAGEVASRPPRRPWRLAAALAVDLGVVAVVLVVLGLLTGLEVEQLGSVVSTMFIVGTLSLLYLVAARRSVGLTAGEALLRVRYP